MNNLLNVAETCHFFGGINRATLYRGIAKGRYPKPVPMGPKLSRWLRSECEDALAKMIAARDSGQGRAA